MSRWQRSTTCLFQEARISTVRRNPEFRWGPGTTETSTSLARVWIGCASEVWSQDKIASPMRFHLYSRTLGLAFVLSCCIQQRSHAQDRPAAPKPPEFDIKAHYTKY